ncbi:hypothetical protein FY528_01975 [Hymenobacter lutimineralis]|uniref:PsbP C-terminal domain-containing protein n=1 Tax=Hymenobacter lutimineralis TaxID=2606448 RepID=A0A5D6VI94_9BACT|nr:hypothetical protein [Hymenobacter lutimineralis]TYZ14519.1 hypothetical protein FY528_01975 [Hymenobacter lutimineralis]
MEKFCVCLCFLLLLIGRVGQCQIVIPEAKLKVTLPNSSWSALSRQELGERLLYSSKRLPIVDKAGRSIIPNMAFLLEEIPSTVDLQTFSAELQRGLTEEQPDGVHDARVVNMYKPDEKNGVIRLKNMLGYQLTYLDKASLSHTVYVVYLVHNDVGVQAIFDSTSDVFAQCEPEFLRTIHSIVNLP